MEKKQNASKKKITKPQPTSQASKPKKLKNGDKVKIIATDGDKVKIITTSKASSYGDNITTGGIGLNRNKELNKKKSNIKIFQFNKKILLVLVVIFIIGVLVFFNNNSNNRNDDGLKYNNNKSFTKEQEVEGIAFKNIQCTFDGKDSTISYTIINKTEKKIYLNNYDLVVKDKDNNKLTRIAAHFTDTIEPEESLDRVDMVVGVDLTDAYYMELNLNTKEEKNK